MDLIRLVFQLGVLFAIYSFIWFFIDLGLALLVAGRKRALPEIYLIKNNTLSVIGVIPSATVLVVYFLGKFQQKQRQAQVLSQFGGKGFGLGLDFDRRYEIGVIALAVMLFSLLLAFPEYADNNIATWFRESIIDIEKTVIIGFIFKVIGFFFLLGMLLKMVNAFNYLISGRPLVDFQTYMGSKTTKKTKDDFDDYEEINE